MPNLLNQPKHEESEPKLALQIRNQKQKSRRGAKEEWKKTQQEISHQGANFRTVRKCWLVQIVSLPFVDLFDFIFSFSTFSLLV